MSVQLEALAEEVFEAASAQSRLGSHVERHAFGEVIVNTEYPELGFLNGIGSLVAPGWSVGDFETIVNQRLRGVRQIRASSRDPATVATLGAALTAAGYHHEVRVAMVLAFLDPSPSGSYRISRVDDGTRWSDFEGSIRMDSREHGWSQPMIEQFLALTRWRAANTAHRFYLLYRADQPLAHVGLFQHRATAYLHGLYTCPRARRRGAGSTLMQAMAREAASIGCDRLTLQCIDDGYLPGYYAQLGYRAVGEQHLWTKPS